MSRLHPVVLVGVWVLLTVMATLGINMIANTFFDGIDLVESFILFLLLCVVFCWKTATPRGGTRG